MIKKLLFLLAFTAHAQVVKLTWQQPPNPGWKACTLSGVSMCLYGYIIVDSLSQHLYVVPIGDLSYSVPAAVGTHTYAIWLGGIDSTGNFTSSMPPATTTVKVAK